MSILSMIPMDGTYDKKMEFGRRSENPGNKDSWLLRQLGMLALGRKTTPNNPSIKFIPLEVKSVKTYLSQSAWSKLTAVSL